MTSLTDNEKRGWRSEETVKHYDRVASVLIPRREEMLSTIVNLLPFSRNKAVLVMDLGAGFGDRSRSIDENISQLADERLNLYIKRARC